MEKEKEIKKLIYLYSKLFNMTVKLQKDDTQEMISAVDYINMQIQPMNICSDHEFNLFTPITDYLYLIILHFFDIEENNIDDRINLESILTDEKKKEEEKYLFLLNWKK